MVSGGNIMLYKNSVEDIRLFLNRFQEQYSKKNIKKLDNFIKEFFVDEYDTSLIGSGKGDLYFGTAAIKTVFASYWTNEDKYLSNIELDINNSKITIEGNSAVITICGKNTMTIEKQKMYKKMIDKISKNLNQNNVSKIELMRVSNEISRTFYEACQSNEYIWPFRLSGMVIYNGESLKFKHINISFGACNGWESWISSDNIDKSYFMIPAKSKDDSEKKAIMRTLLKLQEAYKDRDINSVEALTEDIFMNTKDAFIFGTDEGENFEGERAAKDLLESDFKYWGDFSLNAENSFISVNGNMAWVFSKAFQRDTDSSQHIYDSLGDLYHNYIITSDKSNEEKLLLMLWKTTKRLYDAEFGSIFNVPMKFTGVLIKKDNKWRILHMHFSDYIDGMPEERQF